MGLLAGGKFQPWQSSEVQINKCLVPSFVVFADLADGDSSPDTTPESVLAALKKAAGEHRKTTIFMALVLCAEGTANCCQLSGLPSTHLCFSS